jgi:phosphoglycolate phosphatase-like HAD superfamily hydrolase
VSAIALDLDGVLGDTRGLWRAWLEDAARRYRSIAPLDPDALPEDRARAAEELDRWALDGVGDWRAALERFAEDRAPLHLRPDPAVNALLRRLGAAGVRVGAFTDAPEPLARVAAAQLGAARRLDALEAGPGAFERLLARLPPPVDVARTRAELARRAG